MNLSSIFAAVATASVAFALLFSTTAKAGHVYAGIIDTNGTPGLQEGDTLAFLNTGSSEDDPARGKPITGADYGTVAVRGKVTDSSSPQLNLFATKEPTFTALSRGLAMGKDGYMKELKDFAASAHSFIELKLVSVAGPQGAQFSFWETGSTAATFTYTIGKGLTAGAGIFQLTDPTVVIGNGTDALPILEKGSYKYPQYGYSPNPARTAASADGLPVGFVWNHSPEMKEKDARDPFGHIHGRRFTFDQPGDYSVTYILTDASGAQSDSAPFTLTYSVSLEEATKPDATGKAAPNESH